MNLDEAGIRRSATRPQSLMLSFLGLYVLDTQQAVYSGSFIDVFARVGVSEEAVRSTLTRMVKRGLLSRRRGGRKMYFGLTDRATRVLEDGQSRIWETGAVNREWDGTWTMVGFSLPDDMRSARHDLRSQLVWSGFGHLQSGLWVAAGTKDVPAVLDGLDVAPYVTTFRAQASPPTTEAEVVQRAFDTTQIADRYRAFTARWGIARPFPEARDDLARQLVLHSEWLQVVRQDPHLPSEHLPADWPAIAADEVFRALADGYETTARAIADEVLETIRAPRTHAGQAGASATTVDSRA